MNVENFYVDKASGQMHWSGVPTPELLNAVKEHNLFLEVHDSSFSLPLDHSGWRVAIANNLPAALPELLDYDWPGGTEPFQSQRVTAAVFIGYERAFSLSEMGTGKTRAALYALDALRVARAKQGLSTRALVVAPLSTLTPVWESEINNTFFSRLVPVILHGTKRRRLERLLTNSWNVAIINHAGVSTIWYELYDAKFDVVIVDDASAVRNSDTLLWRALNTLVNGAQPRRWTTKWAPRAVPYVWALTGTPTPNAPTDAWALKALVRPAEAGRFTALRDATMRYDESSMRRTWIARSDAPQTIRKYLTPAVRFARSDVYELPPEIVTVRQAQPSAEQKRLIDTLREEARAQLRNRSTITAANAGVVLAKVLQVLGGTVIDDRGVPCRVDCVDRLALVANLVREADAKVLIFAAFRGHIDLVTAALRKFCTVEQIHGAVPTEERNKIFTDFQTRPDPHVIVAHPRTMAHGLTLTAADTIIWYTPVFSSEQYQQANARIARPSQTRHRLIVQVRAHTVEARVYGIVTNKLRLQEQILSLYEDFALAKE